MDRKFFWPVILLAVFLSVSIVRSEFTVGVKEGDWIEYRVLFSGTPPEGHEVVWARSDVIGVQGKTIDLKITSEFADGTLVDDTVTLNLETGQLGDLFIIPANLREGDVFPSVYHGNVTIASLEQRSCAGAVRSVVSTTVAGSIYSWDKDTGILVEGISEFSEYSIHSSIDKTNMWEPEILGLQPVVFYGLILILAVAALALAAFFVLRRKE